MTLCPVPQIKRKHKESKLFPGRCYYCGAHMKKAKPTNKKGDRK